MSNIKNSLILVQNEGKGYNPYRNPDGTFANGPSAMHHDTFGMFSEGGADQGQPSAVVKGTLSGMLRLGNELSKGNAKEYIEGVEKRNGGETELTKILKDIPVGASQEIVGKVLTAGYKGLNKQVTQHLERPSKTTDQALEKKQKSYFERSKKFANGTGYLKAQGEIYSALAAIAATTRAI